MSEGFTIHKATRTGVNPLIEIYSESGCGKTMSALLLARGMAGPAGKVTMAAIEKLPMIIHVAPPPPPPTGPTLTLNIPDADKEK